MIKKTVQKIMLFTAILMSFSTPYAFADENSEYSQYEYAQSINIQHSVIALSGELNNPVIIDTEVEAQALLDSLTVEEKLSLRVSFLDGLSKVKKKWLNEDYCVPAGRMTLAVSIGFAVTIILMPVSIALLLLSVPVSAVDLATGCRVILDL